VQSEDQTPNYNPEEHRTHHSQCHVIFYML